MSLAYPLCGEGCGDASHAGFWSKNVRTLSNGRRHATGLTPGRQIGETYPLRNLPETGKNLSGEAVGIGRAHHAGRIQMAFRNHLSGAVIFFSLDSGRLPGWQLMPAGHAGRALFFVDV